MGASSATSGTSGVASWAKYVRVLNVLTALVQLLAGLGSLTQIFSLDVPATFIAVYVMLLALLLLAFECRLASTDAFLHANFGFLYSLRGRGAYLLFLGLLDFGMAGGLFGYAAGAAACFSAFVLLSTSVFATTTAEQVAGSNAEDKAALADAPLLPTYGSSAPGNAFPTPPPAVDKLAPKRAPPPPPPVPAADQKTNKDKNNK